MWVRVSGYGRFASAEILRLGNKITALVGPNEAGKTSLLGAIEHLCSDGELQRSELTRGGEVNGPVLEGAFFLDDADRDSLSDLPCGEGVRWLHVSNTLANPVAALRFDPRSLGI